MRTFICLGTASRCNHGTNKINVLTKNNWMTQITLFRSGWLR